MKPRAFVIMPFGAKAVVASNGGVTPEQKIDFDRVYAHLLEPALKRAGFEPARADGEVGAGDIRTDMFFELVTADLVVADISILNANVFYELGIRHGVCPRGILTVQGNATPSRPFDVAPDRSFSYDASLFVDCDKQAGALNHKDSRLEHHRDSLAKRFKDAVAVEQGTIGSPVYSHLPGLKPVNWEGVETAKAKYFTALRNDWLDCVRVAQANGRPGDILTLAMNAPTRLHEALILYEAAIALIDLGRYAAAEPVLRDVIRLKPDHGNAQVQLALILSRLGRSLEAEHQLRRLLQEHKDDPQAADLLGQVLRHLWHLSWHNASDRRATARDAADLAVSAIYSFYRAHRADPKSYFAGFNALMLAYVLKGIECDGANQWISIDLGELKTLVKYTARNEKEAAIEEGNYVEQFWCTTTLAGILLIEGDEETALKHVREACVIPSATSYQLQTFRDRLQLLFELDVSAGFVQRAMKIVDDALGRANHRCSCERVFLWSGYRLANDKRPSPFCPDRVESVSTDICKALEEWKVGEGDLGICGGTTESDVIFAEQCLGRGARIRILMREPVGHEGDAAVWPFATEEWQQRFRQLVASDRAEVWFDNQQLGTPPSESGKDKCPVKFSMRRQNQWLSNTANMEASLVTELVAAKQARPLEVSSCRLFGLFLWDHKTSGEDDPSWLIQRVNEFDGYRGQLKIIAP
jgi:tetratricopeptide (TPR) repeat protein